MTEHEIGVLHIADRVTVNGRSGIIVSVHEPEWVDHKTRGFRKELKGADIRFEDGQCVYVHAIQITPCTKNGATK